MGTEVVQVMTEIEPSEVVAHGAAVWARMTQEHPELFTTSRGYQIPDDEYWAAEEARKRGGEEHDEL